jgi:3-methyl-2-oxobutanoate hydroxymethyltransferase
MSSHAHPITVPEFTALKGSGRKISMLTAYDHTTARLLDATGIEGILVGDSLSMVVQGRPNTLRTSLDEIIYHTEMVARAVQHALVVADMPFLSYHTGIHRAIENAGRILKETACQAVKLEGGAGQADVIAALIDAGIPVMGHCGLRPQSIMSLGGYSVQRDREQLMTDAKAVEQAGAFALVLECIPVDIADEITSAINIPTIGIGAGAGCDGQILVVNDLLGLTSGRLPQHVKVYANLSGMIQEAVGRYLEEVRSGTFPGADQSFR